MPIDLLDRLAAGHGTGPWALHDAVLGVSGRQRRGVVPRERVLPPRKERDDLLAGHVIVSSPPPTVTRRPIVPAQPPSSTSSGRGAMSLHRVVGLLRTVARLPARPRCVRRTPSACERYDLRSEQRSISRHKGNLVHDAGGGDQLVGRIATYVEARARTGDITSQGPNVNLRESSDYLGFVQINLDPAQLGEPGDFPKHNRGDAP